MTFKVPTYDAQGAPVWYALPACTFNTTARTCAGTLNAYRATGSPLTGTYTSGMLVTTPTGTLASRSAHKAARAACRCGIGEPRRPTSCSARPFSAGFILDASLRYTPTSSMGSPPSQA